MKKLVLLLSICIIINNINAHPNSTLPHQSSQPSIVEFLQPDGTLNVSNNFRGSLDLSGFNVYMDECKGIVAIPQSNAQADHCMKEEAMNSTWSALTSSGGINGVGITVLTIAIDGNNNVYVGGAFTTLGDGTTTANRIAKWDGINWSALTSSGGINGLGNAVLAIAIDDNNHLYVGGVFTTLGDGTTTVNRIAKWDGTNWTTLTSSGGINGVGSSVNVLKIDGNDNVYVGGQFTTLGDGTTTANRMAKWDGTDWSALTSSSGINGIDGNVLSIVVDKNNHLYVGGQFTTLGDGTTTANYIAKWDGTNWSPLISNIGINGLGYSVHALAIDGNDNLYVSGVFTTLGDEATTANHIAKWDGTDWSALISSSGINGLGNSTQALAIDGSNNVYVGGGFTTLGDGTTANRIAKWDGTDWSTLGTGLGNNIVFRSALALGTDGLYVGGSFTTAGGITANYIAKWDGASLPVELTNFNVKNTSNGHLLTWQTASEKNNEGFDIQRSEDGRNWENIGFVQGHGTTQNRQEYTFLDKMPLIGSNYYRLKQVDLPTGQDGQFEYSDIVNIEYLTSNHELRIFPNPVTDELNIIDGEGLATIYNLLGQSVKQFKINSRQFKINTSDLAEGQYILHIQNQKWRQDNKAIYSIKPNEVILK